MNETNEPLTPVSPEAEGKAPSKRKKTKIVFAYQPLLLVAYVIASLLAFSFPLFPKNPAIYLGSDSLLAGDFSGFAIATHFPLSTVFFSFLILSFAYLAAIGVFASLYPTLREVKMANLLLFPGLSVNALSSFLCLYFAGKGVADLDEAYRSLAQVPQTLDSPVLSFVEPSYYVLSIAPCLVLFWWLLVNIFNYHAQKKKPAEEKPQAK